MIRICIFFVKISLTFPHILAQYVMDIGVDVSHNLTHVNEYFVAKSLTFSHILSQVSLTFLYVIFVNTSHKILMIFCKEISHIFSHKSG